jgi:hypothetical protein
MCIYNLFKPLVQREPFDDGMKMFAVLLVDSRWPMPRLVTAEPSCVRCREYAWPAMRTTIGRH